MPRLLVTAEAFGFGPPSKLHTICSEFVRRGFDCHFVGHDVALTFARSNPHAFASVTPVRQMQELAAIAPDGFDAAVSVMDPFLALWASHHGLPCVYVDSLFWFWQWPPEQDAELRRTTARLRTAGGVDEALRSLHTIPMHATQYAAHALSTVTCAQRSPGIGGSVDRGWRVEVVDAIVDLSCLQPGGRDVWLATTSGVLNPLMPIEPALRWTRVAAGLIDEAARSAETDAPVLLAGNPDVLGRAAGVLPDRVRPAPMDHRGILRAMNRAIACLTPPGLTTMLESAAYGAPVVLLPEQHYGHFRNYVEMSRGGPDDAFPQALINTRVDRRERRDFLVETQALLDRLTTHFEARDEVWTRLVEATAAGMARAARDGDGLRAVQARAIGDFAGGFSGVEQIADVLQALLERASTASP